MPANAPKGQLYDMRSDPGESTNLYESRPDVVSRLLTLLREDVERGRSTRGSASRNDVDPSTIKLWKSESSGKPAKGSRPQKAPRKKKGA
jgi:hypothetical protein